MLAGAVVLSSLAGCGRGESGDRSGANGAATSGEELAPVAAEVRTTQPADDASTALAESAGDDSDTVTPEALSTGPLLQWTEIDLGRDIILSLQSTRDGKVVITTGAFDGTIAAIVTDDGTNWEALSLPEGFAPLSIDVSGDRWVVFGVPPGQPLGQFGAEDSPHRVFFSDDRGTTWVEATLGHTATEAAETPPDSEWPIDSWVFTSGDRMVIATQSQLESGLANPARIEVRVRLFAGDSPSLSHVAEYEGWIAAATATHDGFALVLRNVDSDTRLLTSSDGLVWSAEVLQHWFADETPFGYAVDADGAVWAEGLTAGGAHITRYRPGEAPAEVAYFEGVDVLRGMTIGAAGFATRALIFTVTDSGNAIRSSTPSWPHQWVGWSADGIGWGWQSILDAFGLDTEGVQVDLAVGRDFLVATVENFDPMLVSNSDPNQRSDEPAVMVRRPPRVFIARVP